MRILISVLGWIYQHFISLLIIIAILIGGAALKRQYKDYITIVSDIEYLQNVNQKLPALIAVQIDQTTNRANQLKVAADGKLKERISVIESNISTLNKDQCNPRKWLGDFKQCLIIGVGSNVQIAILEQERDYLQKIRIRGSIIVNKEMCGKELEKLEGAFGDAFERLKKNEADQTWLKNKYPNKSRIPRTGPYKRYRQLNKDHSVLLSASRERFGSFERQKQICNALNIPGEIFFSISNIEIEKAQAPLRNKLSELERNLGANWWNKLLQPIKVVLPAALTILGSIILMPMAVKAFLYFFIAPVASRRTSNCLMPDTSGSIDQIADLDTRLDISSASKELKIVSSDELLIYPEYIQISPDSGSKDTRWLLDYRFPLSSIASGMFALTRFRPNSESTYVVSAMKDPHAKVAVIAIPAGSAFVLHPRSLVGIVQHRDHPVTITRHWRLTSLHAWLTLQLRYLVFHGPVKLIVEGSHGVSIGKAGQGLSINQSATIGFSANLDYATVRSQTFVAYLSGKQELFNDYFPRGPGYFIYEEKPLFGKRTGVVFGRGLEGFVDSFLKLFGV